MWDKFLNTKIRVVKTDGYVKFGILRGIEANFIFLQYFDGRVNSIQKGDIAHIEPYVENGGRDSAPSRSPGEGEGDVKP